MIVFYRPIEIVAVAGYIHFSEFDENWSPTVFFATGPINGDREDVLQVLLQSGFIEPLSAIKWSVPYWLIVLPVTTASAYLLLTNPRSARGSRLRRKT